VDQTVSYNCQNVASSIPMASRSASSAGLGTSSVGSPLNTNRRPLLGSMITIRSPSQLTGRRPYRNTTATVFPNSGLFGIDGLFEVDASADLNLLPKVGVAGPYESDVRKPVRLAEGKERITISNDGIASLVPSVNLSCNHRRFCSGSHDSLPIPTAVVSTTHGEGRTTAHRLETCRCLVALST